MKGGLPRPIAWVIGAVGLVLVGIGLSQQYTWDTFPNSPFQQAASYIRDQWQEGDVVIHQNKLSALPTVYYARDLNQQYLADAPGSREDTLALPTQEMLGLLADPCMAAASTGANRVWWVIFDFAAEQYAEAGRVEVSQSINWLDEHYTRGAEQQFNDLDVVLYTDPRGEWTSECVG